MLKLANPLAHEGDDLVMSPVGQAREVLRTVIVLDSVEMVDDPSIRERLTVSDLPIQKVLSNVAVAGCSGMRAHMHQHIAFAANSPALPERMALSLHPGRIAGPASEGLLLSALSDRSAPWASTFDDLTGATVELVRTSPKFLYATESTSDQRLLEVFGRGAHHMNVANQVFAHRRGRVEKHARLAQTLKKLNK